MTFTHYLLNLEKDIKAHIEYLLCVKINGVKAISGGDISKAFLLETESERFFCKVNSSSQALRMLQAEKVGLDHIAKTKTIATPKVLLCESLENGAFLLMEFIAPKRPSVDDMALLGRQLAALHQMETSGAFGFKNDNFIGSLPQSNSWHDDWATFYFHERLLPQLKIALDNQSLLSSQIPSENQLMKVFHNLLPKTKPALLHGDLWAGNYIIGSNGTPFLIDTAVYYGHHEVDLAMSRLFGGFDSSFYDAHKEVFPEIGGEKERSDFYQLYYLLVHLNLFGRSYLGPVRAILKRYF